MRYFIILITLFSAQLSFSQELTTNVDNSNVQTILDRKSKWLMGLNYAANKPALVIGKSLSDKIELTVLAGSAKEINNLNKTDTSIPHDYEYTSKYNFAEIGLRYIYFKGENFDFGLKAGARQMRGDVQYKFWNESPNSGLFSGSTRVDRGDSETSFDLTAGVARADITYKAYKNNIGFPFEVSAGANLVAMDNKTYDIKIPDGTARTKQYKDVLATDYLDISFIALF